jgi:hypothetical protein
MYCTVSFIYVQWFTNVRPSACSASLKHLNMELPSETQYICRLKGDALVLCSAFHIFWTVNWRAIGKAVMFQKKYTNHSLSNIGYIMLLIVCQKNLSSKLQVGATKMFACSHLLHKTLSGYRRGILSQGVEKVFKNLGQVNVLYTCKCMQTLSFNYMI